MNENINLCEILKGHEGEIFWSPLYGNVKLLSASYDENFPIRIEEMNEARRALLLSNGHYSEYDEGECLIFPSKDQRDWNKWIEEQKHKTPKTWGDLVSQGKNKWLN